MEEESNNSQIVEKTLKEQIIEKMISKLKNSENFTDELLKELEVTDLSSNNDVKETIYKESEEVENEDTEA